ncbi:MAG: kinase [Candidatus Omnitrophica bacterium]|nr:kinase [Candidatus Omnitrophota bacterium]MBI3021774.1 kinase [Candidatus Omnitrophota bacterium]MBI3083480.1 kinase [Candidatus Omnitrophota bacterium]
MIISRTPFRISFFGGGTDYPVWYREHGGAVLATTINKYCYITCRWLPPFFEHRSRIVYSKVETVASNGQIEHPAVRGVLQFLQIERGVEVHHDGDLPARTGLGSSSSFTVGLLHALYGLKGIMPSKPQLARDATYMEQELLKEHVGSQDQIMAAFGGFNRIDFSTDGSFRVSPVILDEERLALLEDHLMLVFTGLSRTASEIAAAQVEAIPEKRRQLHAMCGMVEEAMRLLQGRDDLERFGRLLHEGWLLKRSLTNRISTPLIDELYEASRRAGALGGKLLGAGGGGFLLLFVRPEEQAQVRQALGGLLHVPFRVEHSGSRVIFYEPEAVPTPPPKEARLMSVAVNRT